MPPNSFTALLPRRVIALSGDGVENWLSGLITNSLSDDISFAALLTPQGKILADFFIHKADNAFLLETADKFADVLIAHLKIYRLRAKIDIEDISTTHKVYVFWGEDKQGMTDPRYKDLGTRFISPKALTTTKSPMDYDLHRLALGIPDSQWDFGSKQHFPHDVNMDLLNGVDFKKGCFIGQEVVSRMQRKTKVRKRMRPVRLMGSAIAGMDLISANRPVGTLKHVRNDLGVAIIRLDRLDTTKDDLSVAGHKVEIWEPDYVQNHS